MQPLSCLGPHVFCGPKTSLTMAAKDLQVMFCHPLTLAFIRTYFLASPWSSEHAKIDIVFVWYSFALDMRSWMKSSSVRHFCVASRNSVAQLHTDLEQKPTISAHNSAACRIPLYVFRKAWIAMDFVFLLSGFFLRILINILWHHHFCFAVMCYGSACFDRHHLCLPFLPILSLPFFLSSRIIIAFWRLPLGSFFLVSCC